MRGVLARLLRATGFARDSRGGATIEFVVLSPLIFLISFSLGEAGVLMTRSIMLDRGVDIAVRDLRLGVGGRPSHAQLKTNICANAFLLTQSTCERNLAIETVVLTSADLYPGGSLECIDTTPAEDYEPVIVYDPGVESDIVLVRACLVVKPLMPGLGLGAMLDVNENGDFALVAQSAFMNEPGLE